MFDESIIDSWLAWKAMEDSQWRRDTALGRKVASKVLIEDCLDEREMQDTLDDAAQYLREEAASGL